MNITLEHMTYNKQNSEVSPNTISERSIDSEIALSSVHRIMTIPSRFKQMASELVDQLNVAIGNTRL